MNCTFCSLYYCYDLMQELFKQLPQQRKLSDSELAETKNLLTLKANKKWSKIRYQRKQVHSLKVMLCCTMYDNQLYIFIILPGKVVLLKDLSNVRLKMNLNETRNNLDESVKRLKEIHGESKEVYCILHLLLMQVWYRVSSHCLLFFVHSCFFELLILKRYFSKLLNYYWTTGRNLMCEMEKATSVTV